MPELPEVETIARGLSKVLTGKEIVNVEVLNDKSFLGNPGGLKGIKVDRVYRRAKMVVFDLSNKKHLLIHLKMTGQLIYLDSKTRLAGGHPSHEWHSKLPNKHTRVVINFNDGSTLFFNDLRKFGWVKYIDEKELNCYLNTYGPDAFPKIDLEYVLKRAERMPKSSIKKFIMDQGVIAGVGNIYADEALFMSKILPKRLVANMSKKDFEILINNIESVLDFSISKGGTSDSDYLNAFGEKGGMQDFLKVYHRKGEPCLNNCGGKVERTVVAGRGTHYCPVCQDK